MPLLAPLFLLGLAAVGVPLLVHLVHRERREPTAFPSLMFLDRTPAPFASRRHIRDPLLFALRVLAIVLLALAFARPVFSRAVAAGSADQRRREVVVLLDRSFSMRIGARWPRARAAADSVIRSLGRGDRMSLVVFDRHAAALTASTSDAATLRTALEGVQPSDEGTRLAPAVALAQQRLAASDAPRHVLVVISDFQRTAWDLTDEARLPAGSDVVTVDVAGTAAVADRSVRAVEVRRASTRDAAPRALVSARVSNAGAAQRGVPVRLEIAGRVVEERTLDLPADGSASVTFAPVTEPPEPVPARVVLATDAVPGDDGHHFLLQQSAALPVLLIASREEPYVARALSIGEVPRFAVTTRTPTSVKPADLANARLVLLADGAFPRGVGAAALRTFVEQGGGLFTALGDQASARGWPDGARALLPGAIGVPTDRVRDDGATLSSVDTRHPALSLLGGVRGGDLQAARFSRYRAIDTTAGVLARFDDGTPALVEHAVGRGRVLTFASTLDGTWNDLPRQAAFLPFVQQLVRYAAAWREGPRARGIGASVRPTDLAAGTGARGVTRWVATAPSGVRTTIGGDGAPAAYELLEAGVHELRPGGSPGARPLLVAANIDAAELDFATFDVARLTAALTAPAARNATDVRPEQESLADREARQSAWWYLLLAAALLLIAESVVARRALGGTLESDPLVRTDIRVPATRDTSA